MPIARFQMPDGRIARFEVPDGTTPEQAQSLLSQSMAAKEPPPIIGGVDPTQDMGAIDRLRAGIGSGMTSAGRAILQGVSKLVGADSVGAGLVKQSDIDEAKKRDSALMATGMGKAGNVIGNVAVAAPTVLIPGANTYTGAALIGAGTGGLMTDGDLENRAKGAAFGAVGGVAGKGLGELIGSAASKGKAAFLAAQQSGAQKAAAAEAANKAGYVIPPADLNPGLFTEALSGLSGKIKTAQVASQRNQAVTNRLAREAIGVDGQAPLTADVLQGIRNEAATSGYAPIRSAGEVVADGAYTKALDKIAGQYQGAARSFPGAAKNPVVDMVENLRQTKFDAGDGLDMIKVLRETADKAYRTGDTGLGKASKEAAKALEDQIERHLAENGDKAAMAAFKGARTLIAKTYSVQKALNAQTGDVSAQSLAKELSKGRPLSGGLLTAAQVGQAFPKATQALKEAPKSMSPLDWAVGAMTGASTGNPLMLAATAVRPAVRSALLSNLYQQAALKPSTPGLLTLAGDAFGSPLAQRIAPGQFGLLGASFAPSGQ